MELTATLMGVQSILRNAEKSMGDFTKIRYKGGNEMKISSLVKDMETFLTYKKYYDKKKIIQQFHNELRNITFFLILNTEYEFDITPCVPENAHLINVCPMLSKCLVANILTELDLVQCFCDVIRQLPLKIVVELLDQVHTCIKKSPAEKSLEYSYLCLKEIIDKLNSADSNITQEAEDVDNLTDIAIEIIGVLSRFNTDELETWKKLKIYQHIGYTALKLLSLLHMCDINNDNHLKLISTLAGATIEVLKAVTISVFCTWAETDVDGQPLQSIVAGQAYCVMQKYKAVEKTKELNQILASIAKKPKSVMEQIREADVHTIVMQINKADQNQAKWFTALINTQVFSESKSIECLEKWSHLCSVDDISRLLDLAIKAKNKEINDVIMRCLAHLSCENIILVMTRFNRLHEFNHTFETKHMLDKLKVLLNKMRAEQLDFSKDLLIICLQNTPAVLTQLYTDCLKSASFCNCLKQFFSDTNMLVQINQLAVKTLQKLLKSNQLNNKNIVNYKELLSTLISANVFDKKTVLFKIVYPQLTESFENSNFEALIYELMLVDVCDVICDEIADFIRLLIRILDTNRVKFFEYTTVQKDVNEKVIKYLNTFIGNLDNSDESIDDLNCLTAERYLNQHYVNSIKQSEKTSLYNYVLPKLNVNDHTDCVAKLIKVLPSCVTDEWIDLMSNFNVQRGPLATTDVLTDVLILLCQLVVTQEKTEVRNYAVPALKYCLQNYGILLKDIIYPQCNTLEDNVSVTKKVCQLLREIPDSIKEEEGLKLVTLFSDKTLKSLKDDKQFVISLVAIKNNKISQVLAKKVLSP